MTGRVYLVLKIEHFFVLKYEYESFQLFLSQTNEITKKVDLTVVKRQMSRNSNILMKSVSLQLNHVGQIGETGNCI